MATIIWRPTDSLNGGLDNKTGWMTGLSADGTPLYEENTGHLQVDDEVPDEDTTFIQVKGNNRNITARMDFILSGPAIPKGATITSINIYFETKYKYLNKSVINIYAYSNISGGNLIGSDELFRLSNQHPAEVYGTAVLPIEVIGNLPVQLLSLQADGIIGKLDGWIVRQNFMNITQIYEEITYEGGTPTPPPPSKNSEVYIQLYNTPYKAKSIYKKINNTWTLQTNDFETLFKSTNYVLQ